jgi:hypothetical protein
MSAIRNLPKDQFEELIKTSSTWVEVMTYFRENHSYKSLTTSVTAKKRCIDENIDFSHFSKTGGRKYDLEKKLVNESTPKKTYNSTTLKKNLIKQNLLENKCSVCGLGTIWNGKPIKLQLEHIDGNHYNNELSNLTILCPNCHSQTDTWCGRNISFKNNCIDCECEIGKESTRCRDCHTQYIDEQKEEKQLEEKQCMDCVELISVRANRCLSCAKKQQTRKVTNRPSLEQLEQDLKELKTYTAVGRKYEVSDNSIRKWIKGYKA